MPERAEPDLYFREREHWAPVPEWGRLFLSLGVCVGGADLGEDRVVVGIAAPTRAYIAALASCGVVIGRSVLVIGAVNPLQHFENLIDSGISLYSSLRTIFITITA